MYTGLGNEKQTIIDAAKPGMITITTPALGRNTDIHYDKSVGMNVIETFVASAREDRQKAGRTGRQGSTGNVYYSLNQNDLGEKTIDQVRDELERKAETARQFNEELYDVLGDLQRRIGSADKAFFREQWSKFSAQVESKYRTEKQDGTYNRDQFLQDVVNQFNALSNKPVTAEPVTADLLKQTIDKRHNIVRNEVQGKKNVALGDCMSADIIAYYFVRPENTIDSDGDTIRNEVKEKLTKLFAAVNTKSYVALNNEYIAYLNMGSESRAVIKEAHQAFLSDYLDAQVSQSKNTPFYKRWLGFEGHLNKVVGDFNYLLLFKAMVDFCGEDIKDDDIKIKASIVTLLEEYKQYSWFVSTSKRNSATALIEAIKGKNNIDDIVGLLSTTIIDVMKKDREINTNSFWRKIKPVNASGDSRLQNTLDRALRLASVMTSKSIKTELVKDITEVSKGSDPANAKVTTKSLESVLEHNRLQEPVPGMKGRG